MSKTFKKLTVLLLALAMILSMSVMAFADGEGGSGTKVTAATDSLSGLTYDETNNPDTANLAVAGVSSINLVKDLIAATDGAAAKGNFTFTITPYHAWNAYSANGTALTTPPAFVSGTNQSNVYTATATAHAADGTPTAADGVAVTLPVFATTGDYWYVVTESIATNNIADDDITDYNAVTGVIYGTNDSKDENQANANYNHDGVYYMHVQVLNGETGLVNSVTLHKNHPDSTTLTDNAKYNTWVETANPATYANYDTGVKVTDIENKLYTGSLSITKNVTGNAGSKTELFPVTVTFTKPAGTVVNSNISVSGGFNADNSAYSSTIYAQNATDDGISSSWKLTTTGNPLAGANDTAAATATVTVYVNDNATINISNIPYGINYTIQEELPENDTYTQGITNGETTADTASFNAMEGLTPDAAAFSGLQSRPTGTGTQPNVQLAAGSITDTSDTWTIENHKETAIDVGVITESAPFVAILVVAGAAVVIYSRRKRNLIEE